MKTMRSRDTPCASSQSAAPPIEEPDRPGPSSTSTIVAAGSARMRRRSAGPMFSVRAKGSPRGRTVTQARASATAATRAASPTPMLRRPMTTHPGGKPRAA